MQDLKWTSIEFKGSLGCWRGRSIIWHPLFLGSLPVAQSEKPADLPVQAPTKYETVVNLKVAKVLGLDVPPSLLVRAEELIE